MDMHVYPAGCAFTSVDDIKGKKITVMGLGLNGGGEASVRFFLRHGAFVTVTDMKTREQLLPTIERLEKDAASDSSLDLSRLCYVLGGHRIEDFAEAYCVIKNPGVKIQGNKYLAAAKAIETDISIFLSFTKAPIIAVTGSKGKSSTVSAIDFALREAGFKSFLGGNITVSPLNFLERTDGTTPVVLELSSWQLSDLRGRGVLKPKIAVITKIVPDHQNWYDGMDSYIEDKKLIYASQTEKDFTIVDADEDDYLKETLSPIPGCKCWGDVFAKETKGTVLRYSRNILESTVYGAYLGSLKQEADEQGFARLPPSLLSKATLSKGKDTECILSHLSVPGVHNKVNVLNAALVLRLMGVSPEQTRTVLSRWKGIAHRLERFHEWISPLDHSSAVFYNDSCATVPEATATACLAFDEPVILIAGGTDKNLDFAPLVEVLSGSSGKNHVPLAVYLLKGTGTDKLIPQLEEAGVGFEGPFDSLSILLGMLKTSLLSQDFKAKGKNVSVVFSPGATSFGMFSNEFDRGNKYKEAVKQSFEGIML